MTSAFCCSYYCEICHVPYNTKNHHRCVRSCPQCQNKTACVKTSCEILCDNCYRSFRGKQCFDNHKAGGSTSNNSICELIKRCSSCLKTYASNREHYCDEYFCKQCDKHVPRDHHCYIQPDKRTLCSKNCLYIFYDLESRQEKEINSRAKLHEPNLCIFKQKCDQCIDIPNLFFCQKCKHSRHIIREQEEKEGYVIEKFLEYILNVRKNYKQVIVIAHNGQAYDHQFILNYVLQKTSLNPELLMRGTKIILMEIGNVKFLDSLNYFPMALSKLPKAFNLPSELKKGYFPHLFNMKINEKYTGKLPAIEFYSPDTMRVEERNNFLKWHSEHANDYFVMQHELEEYCKSDVEILTEACLAFRKLFLMQNNVEPFLEAVTIASACNLVFRRNFLLPNTIGLIPRNGYRCMDNQSVEAIKWMICEEKKRNITIQRKRSCC